MFLIKLHKQTTKKIYIGLNLNNTQTGILNSGVKIFLYPLSYPIKMILLQFSSSHSFSSALFF